MGEGRRRTTSSPPRSSELDGTSGTATYGAAVQQRPRRRAEARPATAAAAGPACAMPVDTANDFVLGPLRAVPNDPALTAALTTYAAAPADQQNDVGERLR